MYLNSCLSIEKSVILFPFYVCISSWLQRMFGSEMFSQIRVTFKSRQLKTQQTHVRLHNILVLANNVLTQINKHLPVALGNGAFVVACEAWEVFTIGAGLAASRGVGAVGLVKVSGQGSKRFR